MDFEETIAAIESLAGDGVDVWVYGTGEDAPHFADLSGVLRRMEDTDDPPDSSEEADYAVVFCVGENPTNHINMWPDRFLGAERLPHERAILIRTRDGDLRVGLESRPWID